MLRNLVTCASLLMVVGSQSFAADQIMVCKARHGEPSYYKLVTPFFGKAKVEHKWGGKWLDWCDGKYESISAYETAALCNHKQSFVASEDRRELGVEKGMQMLKEVSILIDFEFGTQYLDAHLFIDEGNSLVEIMNWRIRENAVTYTCEKND